MLANVRRMGELLSTKLQTRIGGHPNVGDIRGRGLFWGVELVKSKTEALPFPAAQHVGLKICKLGLNSKYNIAMYPGGGTADGIQGDHFIVSPPYNLNEEDVDIIVDTIHRLITDFFEEMAKEPNDTNGAA